MATVKPNKSIADEWLEEDKLMLLECWSRDGYTLQDIANKIGISYSIFRSWKAKYPEIRQALSKGAEIVDYKVENALLKSALGYRTKEVKITTLMQGGKVVQQMKEVTEKDQAPNVTACQVWLYNRLPDKWKKNRDAILEVDEEDKTIQVVVKRAEKPEGQNNQNNLSVKEEEEDQDSWNSEIEIQRNGKQTAQKQHKTKPTQQKEASTDEWDKLAKEG